MWFFVLIYIIVGLVRESYLEFVAAQCYLRSMQTDGGE